MRSPKYWWRRILCWLWSKHFYAKYYSKDGPPYYCHSTCVFCGRGTRREVSTLEWQWGTLVERTFEANMQFPSLFDKRFSSSTIHIPDFGGGR